MEPKVRYVIERDEDGRTKRIVLTEQQWDRVKQEKKSSRVKVQCEFQLEKHRDCLNRYARQLVEKAQQTSGDEHDYYWKQYLALMTYTEAQAKVVWVSEKMYLKLKKIISTTMLNDELGGRKNEKN